MNRNLTPERQHRAESHLRVHVITRLEFLAVWTSVQILVRLPPGVSRGVGRLLGAIAFRVARRLRRVGEQNLERSLPGMEPAARDQILRSVFLSLGQQVVEFCRMSRYTPEEASRCIRYDGLHRYLEARDRGKGVLVLTGHLGAWELSSFYHSLMGYPMGMVIRRLDNPLVDTLVNTIRCLHGNRVLPKDDFARGLLAEMRAGGTVGILMDTNMTPPQGLFVPFFGMLACTASGLARIARKTGAAVLPGFLLWERSEQRYVLHFGEELRMDRTGDESADILTNTARCTATLESYIRRYPDQWLWMHRRWKTRPPGEDRLY